MAPHKVLRPRTAYRNLHCAGIAEDATLAEEVYRFGIPETSSKIPFFTKGDAFDGSPYPNSFGFLFSRKYQASDSLSWRPRPLLAHAFILGPRVAVIISCDRIWLTRMANLSMLTQKKQRLLITHKATPVDED
jgi:hypothetical protein